MEFLLWIGLIAVIVGLVWFLDNRNKKIVIEKSEKVKALMLLNNTVHFKTLRAKYNNYQACNTKRQFDNFSINDYLVALIEEKENLYRNIIQSIEKNKEEYKKYLAQMNDIQSTATEEFCETIKFKRSKFLKYEERLFNNYKLKKPQMDVIIYCKASYISPKGKNSYCKDCSYHYSELKKFFDYTLELKEKKQTRQYQIKMERAKMSDSLRYDILKRDNFTCQICGSKVEDGVKLHVDHIVPVAKGGKTVPTNLRTLCDRCNMGKSDKTE